MCVDLYICVIYIDKYCMPSTGIVCVDLQREKEREREIHTTIGRVRG
jgi:hypothetical protein